MKEGPIIFFENKGVNIIYFNITNGEVKIEEEKNNLFSKEKTIQCFYNTDESFFEVELDFNFSIPETYYNLPDKLLVISDIEGNFEAFRNLLFSNSIINEHFDWTFGLGHLVLNGDFIDRGNFGIQCLWLIIRLEQLAEKAGGKVHFVLGNHEIMNMQGEHRYADVKYDKLCQVLNIEHKELYSVNTYIGKWLSTKNLVEKIGNILFTHAGICPEIALSGLSLKQINKIGRKNLYGTTNFNIVSNNIEEIIMSNNGPFWYRNYFYAPKNKQAEIEMILNCYKVKYISVGHTRQTQIHFFYNNKVINTNVDHSEFKKGLSEALLIEKNIFCKVNEAGEKEII
ncbi:MAG: metallophosphoesterase [Chlorobi bacterium]|nr:metallophosphoesterase [Chlorobiota bacterium]